MQIPPPRQYDEATGKRLEICFDTASSTAVVVNKSLSRALNSSHSGAHTRRSNYVHPCAHPRRGWGGWYTATVSKRAQNGRVLTLVLYLSL